MPQRVNWRWVIGLAFIYVLIPIGPSTHLEEADMRCSDRSGGRYQHFENLQSCELALESEQSSECFCLNKTSQLAALYYLLTVPVALGLISFIAVVGKLDTKALTMNLGGILGGIAWWLSSSFGQTLSLYEGVWWLVAVLFMANGFLLSLYVMGHLLLRITRMRNAA